jgi:ABC-type glycerol-3-phosphate transport system permease component
MIFAFNGVWTDYLTPVLYLSSDKTLLPVLMANAFRNPQGHPYTTWTLAANIVYAMPLIIVFFFAQKYILKGVVTTGLKG